MESPGVFTIASVDSLLLLLITVPQSKIQLSSPLCPQWRFDWPGSFQLWLRQGHLEHPGAIFTSSRNTEFRLALPPAKEELVVGA